MYNIEIKIKISITDKTFIQHTRFGGFFFFCNSNLKKYVDNYIFHFYSCIVTSRSKISAIKIRIFILLRFSQTIVAV